MIQDLIRVPLSRSRSNTAQLSPSSTICPEGFRPKATE
jgi:hypothetical protein